MNPGDIIAIIAVLLIIGGAVFYIVRSKMKGNHCIGCPDSATCPHRKSGGCPGCNSESPKEDK